MTKEVSSWDLCLAVIAREPVYDALRRFFDPFGVRLCHTDNITDLFRTLPETQVNGIVTDIPILVRASLNDKMLFEGIEGIFPNIRLNWNEHAGFRILFTDPKRSGEEHLRAFLQRCLAFSPRPLRRNDRKECHLNLLMWEEGEPEDRAHKAFTMDVSHNGLFVCTCDPPPFGVEVRLSILELSPLPFRATVRWQRGWGMSSTIPGFGARFLDLDQEQKTALDQLLL